MNRRSFVSLLLAGVIAVPAVFAFGSVADAGALKAQVYLVQAKIPAKLTERALIGFARKNANKILRETTGAPVKERKWQGEMVVSFNAPVNDMEFQVLFYDVGDGGRKFVNDMSTMVNDRKQKTFVQKFSLPRPSFKPNREMELVVTVKRAEVGRLRFNVMGEEIKRSGEVSFGDNER